jgi:hypothetical protein
MSWDIFVQDLPSEVSHVSEIGEDFVPRPLGSRSDITRRICQLLPNATFLADGWGSVDDPAYSIEFNMDSSEIVSSLTLHIRGGDLAPGVVADLLAAFGWRALDSQSETGLFDPRQAEASWQRWRAYRDRVIGPGTG